MLASAHHVIDECRNDFTKLVVHHKRYRLFLSSRELDRRDLRERIRHILIEAVIETRCTRRAIALLCDRDLLDAWVADRDEALTANGTKHVALDIADLSGT